MSAARSGRRRAPSSSIVGGCCGLSATGLKGRLCNSRWYGGLFLICFLPLPFTAQLDPVSIVVDLEPVRASEFQFVPIDLAGDLAQFNTLLILRLRKDDEPLFVLYLQVGDAREREGLNNSQLGPDVAQRHGAGRAVLL